jgi:hypothetical protein
MVRCQPPQKQFSSAGDGEGCALYISQDQADPGGWKLILFAQLNERDSPSVVIGEFTVTAAAGNANLNRCVAVAGIPGALRFSVVVQAPSSSPTLPPLQVGLVASKVFTLGVVAVLP